MKTGIIAFILLILVYIVISPFVLLWAINGLFNTGLEYSFMNYCYTLIILIFLRGSLVKS
jgi:hypothetical protein